MLLKGKLCGDELMIGRYEFTLASFSFQSCGVFLACKMQNLASENYGSISNFTEFFSSHNINKQIEFCSKSLLH